MQRPMWESFAQLVVLGAAYQAIAQQATTPYPNMAPIDQYFMTDQGPEYPWRDVWRRATLHAMRRSWFLGVNGFETAVILMDYYNSTIAIQYSTVHPLLPWDSMLGGRSYCAHPPKSWRTSATLRPNSQFLLTPSCPEWSMRRVFSSRHSPAPRFDGLQTVAPLG